jgi:hypothetical protein
VDELQGALDPIAQNSRTSAVMSTQEGTDILVSGGRDLSPGQRALRPRMRSFSRGLLFRTYVENIDQEPRVQLMVRGVYAALDAGAASPRRLCSRVRGRTERPFLASWPEAHNRVRRDDGAAG